MFIKETSYNGNFVFYFVFIKKTSHNDLFLFYFVFIKETSYNDQFVFYFVFIKTLRYFVFCFVFCVKLFSGNLPTLTTWVGGHAAYVLMCVCWSFQKLFMGPHFLSNLSNVLLILAA